MLSDDWSLVVHVDASTFAVLPVVPDERGAFELGAVPSGTARLVRRGPEDEPGGPTTWEEVLRRRLTPGAHARFEPAGD